MELKVGDCVERRSGRQKLAGRVSDLRERGGVTYAVVWWTDGRNPTEEIPGALDKIPNSECKRGKHPR